jgi:hypothetical protein
MAGAASGTVVVLIIGVVMVCLRTGTVQDFGKSNALN